MSLSSALVIDDDEQDRAVLRMHLEDAGLEVIAPAARYEDVSELVDLAVSTAADVTVCDHRLQPQAMAPFFGAQAVAELVQRSQVAVLVTSYTDVDFDTSIRLYRQHIPALLTRADLEEPDSLEEIVKTVQGEISGVIPSHRQLHPTIIRVADVSTEGGLAVLDVFVSGWQPSQAVRMPALTLPEDLQARLGDLKGRFVIAEVNTGAAGKEDLFFGKILGEVEPADWPVQKVGEGVSDLRYRSDAPRNLFRDA